MIEGEECPPEPYECWNGVIVREQKYCDKKPVECWNGNMVSSLSDCPPELFICADGQQVREERDCVPSYVCHDDSVVFTKEECPQEPTCNFERYMGLDDCEHGPRNFTDCECPEIKCSN